MGAQSLALGLCLWCGWAPAPPEDCDHWSPDLQARAFAAADDEEYADWCAMVTRVYS